MHPPILRLSLLLTAQRKMNSNVPTCGRKFCSTDVGWTVRDGRVSCDIHCQWAAQSSVYRRQPRMWRHPGLLWQDPYQCSETWTRMQKCRQVAKCLESNYQGQDHEGLSPDSCWKTEHENNNKPTPYKHHDGSRKHEGIPTPFQTNWFTYMPMRQKWPNHWSSVALMWTWKDTKR